MTNEAGVAVQVLRQSRTHEQRVRDYSCEQNRMYQIRRSRLGHCRSLLEQTESCERGRGPATGIVEFILEHANSARESDGESVRPHSRTVCRTKLGDLALSKARDAVSIVKMCLKLGQWTTHGSDRIPWNGTGEECKGERDTETEHSVQLGSSGLGVEGWY